MHYCKSSLLIFVLSKQTIGLFYLLMLLFLDRVLLGEAGGV